MRGVVRDAMAELDLRSAIVSVSVGDTPVLTQAWGESAPGQAATVDMHWRTGSIAIAYLTTALLQLQDRGVLSIDDKLAKWLPDYPRASDITLAMLANSSSGYADYVNLEVLPLYDDVHRQWTQDELIRAALSQPMKCAPGTCFAYSHANFVILGRVMAMASGRPVADLIRTGILEPLGMRETRSDSTAFIPAPVLHAFNVDRGQYEDSTDWSPSWTIGEGAIMTSTIADVMRSAAAIATGRLISPKAYAQWVEPRTAAFAPWSATRYYGMGVFVANGWLLQNPYFFGYSGLMAYLPAQKIAIAVTSTLDRALRPTATCRSCCSSALRNASRHLACREAGAPASLRAARHVERSWRRPPEHHAADAQFLGGPLRIRRVRHGHHAQLDQVAASEAGGLDRHARRAVIDHPQQLLVAPQDIARQFLQLVDAADRRPAHLGQRPRGFVVADPPAAESEPASATQGRQNRERPRIPGSSTSKNLNRQ